MESGKKFAKNGPDGERIERIAYTPADAVNLRYEGFVEQKKSAGPSEKVPAATEKAPSTEKTPAPEKNSAAKPTSTSK